MREQRLKDIEFGVKVMKEAQSNPNFQLETFKSKVLISDMEYLIERVQGTEEHIEANREYLYKCNKTIEQLNNENKHYREVIKASIHELYVRTSYESDEIIDEVVKTLCEVLEGDPHESS